MKKLIEMMLTNLSTREVFLFRISCALCGLSYGNKPIRFTKAAVAPTTPGKQIVYKALHEQELRSI